MRRLIASGDLAAEWSRDEVTRDRNGREIHGHRRVSRASVVAYADRLRGAESARRGRRDALIEHVIELQERGLTSQEIARVVRQPLRTVQLVIKGEYTGV